MEKTDIRKVRPAGSHRDTAWDSMGCYIISIPDMQSGLKAFHPFAKGDFVTSYGGVHTTGKRVIGKQVMTYVTTDRHGKKVNNFIDGAQNFKVREMGRWIRPPIREGERANCRFVHDANLNISYIICMEDIPKHGEFLVEFADEQSMGGKPKKPIKGIAAEQPTDTPDETTQNKSKKHKAIEHPSDTSVDRPTKKKATKQTADTVHPTIGTDPLDQHLGDTRIGKAKKSNKQKAGVHTVHPTLVGGALMKNQANQAMFDQIGIPAGWDTNVDLGAPWPSKSTTLRAEFARRNLKARIVDYYSPSIETRDRLREWLTRIGFRVKMSSYDTDSINGKPASQIHNGCGVVAAKALTLLDGAGSEWFDKPTKDAVNRDWIVEANETLEWDERPRNGGPDRRTRFLYSEEVERLAVIFGKKDLSGHRPDGLTCTLDDLYVQVLKDLQIEGPRKRLIISNTSIGGVSDGKHWFCVMYTIDEQDGPDGFNGLDELYDESDEPDEPHEPDEPDAFTHDQYDAGPSHETHLVTRPHPKTKKKRVPKSEKAGLTFPVGRAHRQLRSYTRCKRVSANAAVYIASVVEFLAADVLQFAGNQTKEKIPRQRKRITPRDLLFALRDDEEMEIFTRHAIIPQAGVLPYIHKSLLPRKKNSQTR